MERRSKPRSPNQELRALSTEQTVHPCYHLELVRNIPQLQSHAPNMFSHCWKAKYIINESLSLRTDKIGHAWTRTCNHRIKNLMDYLVHATDCVVSVRLSTRAFNTREAFYTGAGCFGMLCTYIG